MTHEPRDETEWAMAKTAIHDSRRRAVLRYPERAALEGCGKRHFRPW